MILAWGCKLSRKIWQTVYGNIIFRIYRQGIYYSRKLIVIDILYKSSVVPSAAGVRIPALYLSVIDKR